MGISYKRIAVKLRQDVHPGKVHYENSFLYVLNMYYPPTQAFKKSNTNNTVLTHICLVHCPAFKESNFIKVVA